MDNLKIINSTEPRKSVRTNEQKFLNGIYIVNSPIDDMK